MITAAISATGDGRWDIQFLIRRNTNAGRMIGAKCPLKPRDVWAIRFYLDEHRRLRDRALFDLAIDSMLRGCEILLAWLTCRGGSFDAFVFPSALIMPLT